MAQQRDADRPNLVHNHVTPFLVFAAIAILARTLEETSGHYHPRAIPVVLVAWLLCLAAVLVPSQVLARYVAQLKVRSWPTSYTRPLLLFCGFAWTLYQFQLLLTTHQDSDGRRLTEAAELNVVTLLWAGSIALTILALAKWPARAQAGLFALLVVIHATIGVMVLRMAIQPKIDVWTVEMDAAKALVSGTNPFAITFPDPYHGSSPYFPPGVSVGGRLQFGFVYPPLTLLLCVPGYLLGDTRYATLAAMSVAALLIARSNRTLGLQAMLAGAMFLFTPRTYFVAHRAWTDPFVVMLTALVVYCALQRPRWLYIAAGLYCCVKQHMFIAAPALILLLPRPWSLRQLATFYAKVLAVGLVATLPLALWNVPAFVNSVLNIREVFRTDSLSILAHLANTGTAHLSKWTGIGVAGVVCALGVWRAPRTPSGFALVAATTHFSLYLFSTHAFCNEYYNVIGALCIALASHEAWASPALADPTLPVGLAD